MDPSDRPLSPHIQIYKPQLTSVLSIMHRISGFGLGIGALLLTYWLISIAAGPSQFETAQNLLGSWVGICLLIAWSFGFFFHLCNGVRHLFWDAGKGYELKNVYATGWLVVLISFVCVGLVWFAVFFRWSV